MMLMVNFLLFICFIAILIIGARWLMSLTGLSIPQPLLVILGIILFIIVLLVFVNYVGYGTYMGGPFLHR